MSANKRLYICAVNGYPNNTAYRSYIHMVKTHIDPIYYIYTYTDRYKLSRSESLMDRDIASVSTLMLDIQNVECPALGKKKRPPLSVLTYSVFSLLHDTVRNCCTC